MSRLELVFAKEYGRPLPPFAAPEPVAKSHTLRDMWVTPYNKRATMMTLFNIFRQSASMASRAGYQRY
jgi:putative MFS transporter